MFNTAGQDYTCTPASTGSANVWCHPPAPLPTSENLLAMIATTNYNSRSVVGSYVPVNEMSVGTYEPTIDLLPTSVAS